MGGCLGDSGVAIDDNPNWENSIFHRGNLPPNVIVINDMDLGCDPMRVTDDPTPSLEGYWDRDDINGYMYPKVLADKVIINATAPYYDERLGVTGKIYTTGGIMFGDGDSLIYEPSDDQINVQVHNVVAVEIVESMIRVSSYAFIGDSDTGIYSHAVNGVTVKGGGNDLMRWNSNGSIAIVTVPVVDSGELMNALVYNSINGIIYQRSLSELHVHANITVLGLLADSGGALAYNGVLVFDLSNYYTVAYIDALEGDIVTALAGKSDITHNHNLADLTEKSYNSLNNLPDLSDLHEHFNKPTLDLIPNYLSANEGDVMERYSAGFQWISKNTFPFVPKELIFGSFRESQDARVTSNGTIITMSLEQSGGGNLTMQFSDGDTILDCTPALTIELTPGSDVSPQENYIYIPQSTKVLTKSISEWPSTEHIKVAYLFVSSAAYVATDGALINQNWRDHMRESGNTGHLLHISERLRREPASYFSGIAGTGTDDYTTSTSGSVTVQCSSGIVYQLHAHSYLAKDTSGTDDIHVVNHNITPYYATQNLYDVVNDANGVTLTNKYFNIVLWGVINKTGEYSPLFVNLPTGSYNNLTSAENDVDKYDVFSMPREFYLDSSTGFLIARLTFRKEGTSWTYHSTVDLRGQTPLTAGGAAGGAITSFADNQFEVYNVLDNTKVINFDLSGLTTGVTRTIIPYDGDVSLVNYDGSTLKVDTLTELNPGVGVTIEGVKLEDSQVDFIGVVSIMDDSTQAIYIDNTKYNILLGPAGVSLTTGTYNILMGEGAGATYDTEQFCTAIGYNALNADDSNYGFAIGAYALENSTGTHNFGMGTYALNVTTTQSYNLAIGSFAGRHSAGGNNTYIGYAAGAGISGLTDQNHNNTFIGYNSGTGIRTGDNNTGISALSLTTIGTGSNNVAIGYNALSDVYSTSYNVAIGASAGLYTTGTGNLFIGAIAGLGGGVGTTTGSYNTFIGYSTGSNYTSGNYNILIGYNIDLDTASDSYQFRIGYGTKYMIEGVMSDSNESLKFNYGAIIPTAYHLDFNVGKTTYIYDNAGVLTFVDGTTGPHTLSALLMVYPGAGIALSTGSAWGTSITDNSATWNAAQPGHANLTSLAGLTYASTSFVKMTATGVFSLDTNTYLTGNQTITLSGDVSGSGATSITTTIGANKVTLGMMAQMATASFLGRITAFTGNVQVLTATQATSLLNIFATGATTKGLVPGSNSVGATYYLNGTGNWTVPAGVSFGNTDQIPHMNAGTPGTNFDYSTSLTFDGTTLATGAIVATDTISITAAGAYLQTTSSTSQSGIRMNNSEPNTTWEISKSYAHASDTTSLGFMCEGTTHVRFGSDGTIYLPSLPATGAEEDDKILYWDSLAGKVTQGSAPAGGGSCTLVNEAQYRMVTCTSGADEIQGEANLTYDGTLFTMLNTNVLITDSAGNAFIKLRRTLITTSSRFGGLYFQNLTPINVAGIDSYADGAADSGYLSFQTCPTGGTNTERMRIDSIGITHVKELYVEQTIGGIDAISLRYVGSYGGVLSVYDVSGNEDVRIQSYTYGGYSAYFANGGVVIGATSLYDDESLYVYDNTAGKYAGHFYQNSNTGHALELTANSNSASYYLINGNNSLGQVAFLTSSGLFYGLNFQLSSDARLKNVGEQVMNGLDIALQLTPYLASWKDKRDDFDHIVFLAQDVQKIRPELVGEANGYLTLSYSQITAINNAGIHGLNYKVDTIEDQLRTKIVELEGRIKILEDGNRT